MHNRPALCPECGAFVRVGWETRCGRCEFAWGDANPVEEDNWADLDNQSERQLPNDDWDFNQNPYDQTVDSATKVPDRQPRRFVVPVRRFVTILFLLTSVGFGGLLVKTQGDIASLWHHDQNASDPTTPPTTALTPIDERWMHFVGPSARFSVAVPGTPIHQDLTTNALKEDGWTITSSSKTMVEIDDLYYEDGQMSRSVLDSRMEALITAIADRNDATVKTSTVGGSGIERHLEGVAKKNGQTYLVHIAGAQSHLYAIIVSAANDGGDAETYNRVLASFTTING